MKSLFGLVHCLRMLQVNEVMRKEVFTLQLLVLSLDGGGPFRVLR